MTNPHLPPEILDYTTDLLRNEPNALRNCCLVSKSWVPRTRKHFFSHIRFRSPIDLMSWKKTFTDPANSPAHHTLTLFISCPRAVQEADAEAGGWIRTFSRLKRLTVSCTWAASLDTVEVSLAPFHNFSPSLISLRVDSPSLPLSQVLTSSIPFPFSRTWP